MDKRTLWLKGVRMNTLAKKRYDWRTDLEASRSVGRMQRHGFTMLLGWYENFRLRCGLEAGRESARCFWKSEVLGRGVVREEWSRKMLRLTRSF